jgi:hypothetical protein
MNRPEKTNLNHHQLIRRIDIVRPRRLRLATFIAPQDGPPCEAPHNRQTCNRILGKLRLPPLHARDRLADCRGIQRRLPHALLDSFG